MIACRIRGAGGLAHFDVGDDVPGELLTLGEFLGNNEDVGLVKIVGPTVSAGRVGDTIYPSLMILWEHDVKKSVITKASLGSHRQYHEERLSVLRYWHLMGRRIYGCWTQKQL